MSETTETGIKDHGATTPFVGRESVRITKKSVVVDKERDHEGLSPEAKVPIEADVTGVEGKVCGMPYASSAKDGEMCIPIEVSDGNVLGVPVSRLDPVDKTPRKESSDTIPSQRGESARSKESMEFWADYWKKQGRLEAENEQLKKENAKLKEKVDVER